MYIKKRRIDVEMPQGTIRFDPETKPHLQEKPDDPDAVWVEKHEFKVHSTTGSGGVDLHLYRKEKRWERNEEWYSQQETKKEEVNKEYQENKARVNAILEEKKEKNRNKRLKKKAKKDQKKALKVGEASVDTEEAVQSPSHNPANSSDLKTDH